MQNNRHGTFSSSSIHILTQLNKAKTDFSEKAQKYIKQVGYELQLGRPLNAERDSRPTSWGTFVEKRAFDLLPIEYQLVSQTRLFHPEIPTWSGAPDLIIDSEVVSDVKCPFSLEVFLDKVKALNESVETYKSEFPGDYYQLVSNAVLTGSKYAEAIIYVPYLSELDAIRSMASQADEQGSNWIKWAEDNELPYLIDGGNFKNLNIFRFVIPQADKDLLTSKVIAASKLLQPFS
jgi:hypothetical protein